MTKLFRIENRRFMLTVARAFNIVRGFLFLRYAVQYQTDFRR